MSQSRSKSRSLPEVLEAAIARTERGIRWGHNEQANITETLKALRSESTAHDELLAIHAAVMDPQAVVPNESDTLTVSLVKGFILLAEKLQARSESAPTTDSFQDTEADGVVFCGKCGAKR